MPSGVSKRHVNKIKMHGTLTTLCALLCVLEIFLCKPAMARGPPARPGPSYSPGRIWFPPDCLISSYHVSLFRRYRVGSSLSQQGRLPEVRVRAESAGPPSPPGPPSPGPGPASGSRPGAGDDSGPVRRDWPVRRVGMI